MFRQLLESIPRAGVNSQNLISGSDSAGGQDERLEAEELKDNYFQNRKEKEYGRLVWSQHLVTMEGLKRSNGAQEFIRSHKVELQQCISHEPDHFLDTLHSERVITQSQYYCAQDQPIRRTRTNYLLDECIGAGEHICLKLLKVLLRDDIRKHYPSLNEWLTGRGVSEQVVKRILEAGDSTLCQGEADSNRSEGISSVDGGHSQFAGSVTVLLGAMSLKSKPSPTPVPAATASQSAPNVRVDGNKEREFRYRYNHVIKSEDANEVHQTLRANDLVMDYRNVMRNAGLAETEIQEAEVNNAGNVNEMNFDMLKRWLQSHGSEATYANLMTALDKFSYKRTMESLMAKCDELYERQEDGSVDD